MTVARNQLINIESTPYYHCTSRCVRRAFLCGKDDYTGQSYEHRREWVESLILKLATAFCIDVVAYAVMSNHYHVILRINQALAESLTDEDIIDRWGLIYKPDSLMQDYRNGVMITEDERNRVEDTLRQWRTTLSNLSRFMGYLNEQIARRANLEDKCTGRFWESRFHSQALLDDEALLRCMTYVDLNPVRAGICATPEESDHTSIKHRIDQRIKGSPTILMDFLTSSREQHEMTDRASLPGLDAITDHTLSPATDSIHTLPLSFTEYLGLLDWSSRILRDDKPGAVPGDMPDILVRLGHTQKQWTSQLRPKSTWRPKALGSPAALQAFCASIGQKWVCQRHTPT